MQMSTVLRFSSLQVTSWSLIVEATGSRVVAWDAVCVASAAIVATAPSGMSRKRSLIIDGPLQVLRRVVGLNCMARPFPDDFVDCFIGFVAAGIVFLALEKQGPRRGTGGREGSGRRARTEVRDRKFVRPPRGRCRPASRAGPGACGHRTC